MLISLEESNQNTAHLADVGVAGADVDGAVSDLCSSGGEVGAVLVRRATAV
jgi:hypothetical protein